MLTAVLALRGLVEHSLWSDEGVSAYAVTGSADRLFDRFGREPQFILYHVMLRGWTVFGTTDFTLRLMSVLLAVLTVPVLHAVARRLYGARVAIIAAALLAANGYFLGYAQELRPYSLMVFTSTLATLCVLRAMDTPGRMSRWMAWLVAACLAALSHPFGALVVVAHVVVLLSRRRSMPLREIALMAALPLGIVGLLGLELIEKGPGRLDWIEPPNRKSVEHVAAALAGGSKLVVAYLCCLVALAVVVMATPRDRRSPLVQSTAFGLCWLCVPLAITVAVTLVQPVFLARYLMVMIPPLVVLVAAGVGELGRVPAALITAGLLALAVPTAAAPFRDDRLQDWRGAARFLGASAEPTDVLVHPSNEPLALRYYLELDRVPTGPRRGVTPAAFLQLTGDPATPCLPRRVWAVAATAPGSVRVPERAAAAYRSVEAANLEGVVVTRLELRPTALREACDV